MDKGKADFWWNLRSGLDPRISGQKMQYYDKSFQGDLGIVLSFFVFPSLVWEVGDKSATMLESEYDIISTMQLTYSST